MAAETSAATGLRLSLYDILGLKPDASPGEIEAAFRRELNPFMPHVLGGVAAAGAAYATLRDPAKRRAYDQAHGFAAPPAPAPAAAPPAGNGWAIGNSHMMRAVPRFAVDSASDNAPASKREAPAAPFIAAPAPASEAKPAPMAQRTPAKSPMLAAGRVAKTRLLHPAAERPRPAPVILGMDEAEEMAIDRRKGMVVMGAIGAVALAGGLLGWVAGSDADEARANGVVSTLPAAAARELSIITPAEDVIPPPPEPVAERPRPAARTRTAPKPPVAESSASVEPLAAEPAIASAEPQADDLTPEPVNAAMPLPARTVARTIDRIGYSCGSVTASQSAGGGVFTVTCSSGQRFRASPRNGRYRFKRL